MRRKTKTIAPCTRDFSRASGELQVIARNCDWFMELFVPVVIGGSIALVLVFRQSFENRSTMIIIALENEVNLEKEVSMYGEWKKLRS